jgi:hypothetical protein
MKNHHSHHLHGHKAQINQLLSIIISANIQTLQNRIYRGSGKERGRVFAELLQVDTAVVTVGRTVRFTSTTVMAGRCGPGGGDGRADGVVPWSGDDGDGGGGSRGGGDMVPGAAVKAEEERDGDGGGGTGWLGSWAWQ